MAVAFAFLFANISFGPVAKQNPTCLRDLNGCLNNCFRALQAYKTAIKKDFRRAGRCMRGLACKQPFLSAHWNNMSPCFRGGKFIDKKSAMRLRVGDQQVSARKYILLKFQNFAGTIIGCAKFFPFIYFFVPGTDQGIKNEWDAMTVCIIPSRLKISLAKSRNPHGIRFFDFFQKSLQHAKRGDERHEILEAPSSFLQKMAENAIPGIAGIKTSPPEHRFFLRGIFHIGRHVGFNFLVVSADNLQPSASIPVELFKNYLNRRQPLRFVPAGQRF
ncbi:MAG: hypothetical protein ACD_75C00906G0001 [uncultured bacterium]|nr:MAG: hypothetical protein ACD_75C00906G0001 [uncultured bacterium]